MSPDIQRRNGVMLLVKSGVTTSAPTSPSRNRRVRLADRLLRQKTDRSRPESRRPRRLQPPSCRPRSCRRSRAPSRPTSASSFSRLAGDSGSAEQITSFTDPPARSSLLIGQIGKMKCIARHPDEDVGRELVDQLDLQRRRGRGSGAGPIARRGHASSAARAIIWPTGWIPSGRRNARLPRRRRRRHRRGRSRASPPRCQRRCADRTAAAPVEPPERQNCAI